MSARSLTTALTLVAATVALVIMAVWGFHAVTAPVEDDTTSSSSGPTCPPDQQKITKYVKPVAVTVSVYNAGKKSGRAQATMDQLERAGFKPGEVGNAPAGADVTKAAVYSTEDDDPAAQLVALMLGKHVQVVRSDDELGPGVDVVIGDRFKHLNPNAPRRLELPEPITSCKD